MITSNKKTTILVIVVVIIISSIFYLEYNKPLRLKMPKGGEVTPSTTSANIEEKAKKYPLAKEIVSPSGFINTDNINLAELIGKKVILIDFWTYSCINCQRAMPYLKLWYDKYKDKGLEIIGIHTPEFEFEKKYENVTAAVKKFGIEYPVVLDNDYATWNAYRNRYWPRKYLIDIDGFIVYDHIGEGAYTVTEQKIQELLEERMLALNIQEDIKKDISKPEGTEEVSPLVRISPEIYFGSSRNFNLGNGKSNVSGIQSLTEPDSIKNNTLYLVGDWDFTKEFAENKSSNAKIIFRYQAEKVFIVASSENGVKIRVLRDKVPLGDEVGADVEKNNDESSIFIDQDRLYRVIEDPKGYGEHTLEIIIENPGLRIFTFTFG
ncbi:MAG: redoxin family protein [Patescibacteria group bacterium]|nr:redoxin family protein [Patescibacteria group bacterium]